jgi:hypothetical protein
MRFFTNNKREQSGQLFQRTETSNPLALKLETIKKMKRNGVSRIFVPKITAADIEQHKSIVDDGD